MILFLSQNPNQILIFFNTALYSYLPLSKRPGPLLAPCALKGMRTSMTTTVPPLTWACSTRTEYSKISCDHYDPRRLTGHPVRAMVRNRRQSDLVTRRLLLGRLHHPRRYQAPTHTLTSSFSRRRSKRGEDKSSVKVWITDLIKLCDRLWNHSVLCEMP